MTSMGPPRSPVLPPTTLNSPVKTAHSLAILSEYTHTLDSVPLELSRNFADLRELDAVLSSSMTVVTSKVVELTNLIENRAASREDRLWLLADIADLISKLKPGAEDKIRVACHAADSLRGHKTHMSNLLQHMPEPEYGAMAGMLSRKTVYPHVATRSYVPAGMPGEGGRRQRRTALLTNSGAMEATPHKRKRLVGDDGEVLAKSPVKPKLGESTRARNGARKKNDRATSPAESILSVASHLPQSALPQPISRQNTSQRGASASSTVKRARGQANTDDSRQEFNHPPSSHHPSLPAPFSNGVNETGKTRNTVGDWVTGELEGPGMPVARPFVNSGAASVAPDVDTDGGAANGEGDADIDDGRTYCYCERVSFGEMIACDDSNCEREWFHLACIGLAVAPEGSWICDTCQARRNAKRSGRGGKRRAGGGRAGARNAT